MRIAAVLGPLLLAAGAAVIAGEPLRPIVVDDAVEVAVAADGYGGVYILTIANDPFYERYVVALTRSFDDLLTYETSDWWLRWAEPRPDLLCYQPRVCVAGDPAAAAETTVYALWVEKLVGSDQGDIFINVSKDRGLKFRWAPGPPWPEHRLPPIQLGLGKDPWIACQPDGTAYVVFTQSLEGPAADTFVTFTHDRGDTWQWPPLRVDTGFPPGSTNSAHPKVAIDARDVALGPPSGNHAIVVWDEETTGAGPTSIRARETLDGGRTWQDEVALDPGTSASTARPDLAFGNSGAAFAVWQRVRAAGEEWDIAFAPSWDGGQTWSSPTLVNALVAHECAPQLAVEREPWWQEPPLPEMERIHLLWEGPRAAEPGDILMRYNTGRGNSSAWTWSHAAELGLDEVGAGTGDSFEGRLACDAQGHVHADFDKLLEPDHYYENALYVSTDHGASWPVDARILEYSAYETGAPALAADHAGRAYVGWPVLEPDSPEVRVTATGAESALVPRGAHHVAVAAGGGAVYVAQEVASPAPERHEVYAHASGDDGAFWGPAGQRLSAEGVHAEGPAAATDGGDKVYVAFRESGLPEGDRIVFRASNDRGVTYGAPQFLGDTAAGVLRREVALCALPGGQVHAVWEDGRHGGSAVILRRSADYGITWPYPDQRLDTGNSASGVRIACAPDGGVFVVWESAAGGAGIEAAVSSDHGATFGEVDVSSGPGGVEPSVACDDGGRVYVAWSQDGTSPSTELMERTGLLHGSSWLDPVKLDAGDPPGASVARRPAVVARPGGGVLAAWADGRAASSVYANTSSDGGAHWQDVETALDTNGGTPAEGVVAGLGADGRAFVAWIDRDTPGFSDMVFVNASRGSGATGSWLAAPQRMAQGYDAWGIPVMAGALTRDGAGIAWGGYMYVAALQSPYVTRFNRLRILSGRVGEIHFVGWTDPSTLHWEPLDMAAHYHLYGGDLAELGTTGAACLDADVMDASVPDPLPAPAPGTGHYYLVTGWNDLGEGPLGEGRQPAASCP